MTKQRNSDRDIVGATYETRIFGDQLLLAIRGTMEKIDAISAEYNAAADDLKANYEARLTPLRQILKDDDAAIKDVMRHDKKYLFDGADVVHLPHGSLIHSVADKVSIPRNALEMCEELGFDEVIKIAKSLDRDAVEKWPDERLVLIGAERKSKEMFSYDLKREVKPCPPA